MATSFDHPLIRKLESIAPVQEDEKAAIVALPVTLKKLKKEQDIVREHDRPSQCCLVIEGFLFRYKVVPSGKRQILSFYIPGDIPDLQSLHLERMDHNIASLGPSKVAFIEHETLRAFLHAHPRIGDVFWRDTLIDAAVFREWMVGLARRDAYARIAHLFCEFFVRLRAVGLTEAEGYGLPITQAVLGDALGLSTVHVNRSLQSLRRRGLIRMRNGRVHITNWEGLQEAGEFDPTYLHLKRKFPTRAQAEQSNEPRTTSR
jgi:CRP-like cAMP-binding protein